MLSKIVLGLLYASCHFLLTEAFTNPIKATDGSDPYIVYSAGYYYLTTTTWTNLQITRGATIEELKTASPKVVWTDTDASRCCNVWAPEIHWFEDSWYSYYTAGTANTFDNQHLHVLKGSSADIWDSTWSYAGRIVPPDRDVWAIDATLLFLDSTYIVYSSWDGADQCLWIAKMSSATEIGPSTKISTPEYDWETVDANVNEGAAAIYGGGGTFVVYSASNCAGTGYKLGLLQLTGFDPLSASSWTKFPDPIFESANDVWQPGHNGFFTSPSGAIYNVYHANTVTPGTCDGARYTAIQGPVTWNSDGTPNLGQPLALGTEIAEP
ncbi:glycoside hydrolase family 43 protein [Cylindrobasidium torrendii FP15055 ss-10]|uniref:Glycoside hydrolase family 43 protein n=1 Tax=Cylindrobasidium torrendii FP15055 ss-10 TaxID=1314674 RepID=A0A0D7AYM4_9AGAR|nr:glycoside hydrolase family 43 protein [Cylindrobasidium torrendii FP15055 ss-10]